MKNTESERLADLLFALARYLHREMKARTDVSLNSTQIQTLFFIRCRKNPLMREIADYLSIRPPSATALIEELQHIGFVRRAPDSADKRSVRISLTPRGQRLLRNRLTFLIGRIDAITSPLAAQDRKQFIQTLGKILSNADQP